MYILLQIRAGYRKTGQLKTLIRWLEWGSIYHYPSQLVNFKQINIQKISTGHFLDTFGAFWALLSCRENPKMFNLKGSSLSR